MLTSAIGIVVLLGGLIFFHELGHYSVAKFFKVKVEVFSLGFGKKILRKQVGETEYCLSLVPLGGYVKLMGDDPYKAVPPEEAARAFSTQKLYKRFAIVSAGPLANLLLAYLLFVMVFWFGQPTDGTRIGTVMVNSPAWSAGIRPKDRVTEVVGKKIHTWQEMQDALQGRKGEKLELKIDREGQELRIPYTVDEVRVRNNVGEEVTAGGIKGVQASPLAAVIGVSNTNSAAYKSGLRSRDQILKIGARKIEVWGDVNEALDQLWKGNAPLTVTVKRLKDDFRSGDEQSLTLTLPTRPAAEKLGPFGLSEALGIFPSDLFVKKLVAGGPAEKGGLKAGDRIVKVGDDPVYNFESIVDRVQAQGVKNETVAFALEREGKSEVLQIQPVSTEYKDPLTQETKKKFMIGFESAAVYQEPETVFVKIREPLRLIAHAGQYTYTLASHMVVGFVKLITGQLSVKNLGGPVLIASVAGKSLDAGIIPFLQTMALISINLFLLNLFPVPVLDGGHLLFFSIEAIKGSPVSIRTMEIANQIGMVLILLLVGLTFFNDVTRILLH